METTVKQYGRVLRVANTHLVLQLESDACCGGACGRPLCDSEINVPRPQDHPYAPGERVELRLNRRTFVQGVLWLYGAPVALVLLGALSLGTQGEGWALVGGAAGFGVWLALHWFGKSMDASETWRITEV